MAGCFDPNSWRVGIKARGTRSQFRVNTEGLLPFKCSYPVHLTDVMDAVPSTQADLQRDQGLVSPIRGTRTRAVREYEQTIDVLKKENFDLKLRLYLLEESRNKYYGKNKRSSEEPDDIIQVNVELRTEVESLRNELSSKTQQLQEALNGAEKSATEQKELQDNFVQLQEQLSHLAELQPKQEISSKDENLLKENDYLIALLSEKNLQLQEAIGKLETLSSRNVALEAKAIKSSKAIQGLAHKYFKDVQEVIPKEIRPIVHSAVEAAKSNSEENLVVAIESLKSSLFKIMSTPVETVSYNELANKLKDDSASMQDSVEEFRKSAKSSSNILSNQLSQTSGQSLSNSESSHDRKELSPRPSLRRSLFNQSSDSIYESDMLDAAIDREDVERTIEVLKENERLKADSREKSKTISDLNSTCHELEQRTISLQSDLLDAVSSAKNLEMKIEDEKSKSSSSLLKMSASAQTAVQWHTMQLSENLLQGAGSSNSIDDLKEEILMLLLVIEQKDKDISDLELNITSLQSQLEDVVNKKESSLADMDNMDYKNERNELRHRLALSSSVNNELINQLRNLEAFMEDLLQHKNLDSSSFENLQEASDFLSQISLCLDETLKLSNVLSDNLSVCEGSKIFDPNDVTMSKEQFDHSAQQSYDETRSSRQSLSTSSMQLNPQGRDSFQPSIQESFNKAGTGKRRLSFSTLRKSSVDIDKENVVVLGTSNNEDLILLLNDNGDPKDVLIRNNHSHLGQNVSGGDQRRRRCWESTSLNSWNARKSTVEQIGNSWCAPQRLDQKQCGAWYNHCPSSESDIWSEPDRDVSLQRIGIDVQKSPVIQKSPRRSWMRDKRTTDEPSSQRNESSSSLSKLHSWSKRRKSSESSRTSYMCRKCLSQAQQMDDVTKDEKDELHKKVYELSRKCSSQENQLAEMRKILTSKVDLIDTLNKEKDNLSNSVSYLKEQLAGLRQMKVSPSAENSGLSIVEMEGDNKELQKLIQELEARVSEYDTECHQLKTELGQTKSRLETLDTKCAEYEKRLFSNVQNDGEYVERFIKLESEKVELLKKIDDLTSEKNELLHSIQSEKENNQLISKENKELCDELEKKSQDALQNDFQMAFVPSSTKTSSASREKALSSSSSVCDALRNDLGKVQSSLENLKSKCTAYEEELDKSSEIQQNIIDKLSASKTGFVSNLNTLNEVCRKYFTSDLESVDKANTSSSVLSNLDKEQQIEELLKSFGFVSRRYEQTVDLLSQQLYIYNSEDTEMDEEEIRSLKIQNSQLNFNIRELQEYVEEAQSSIAEYEAKISAQEQELEWCKNDIESLTEHRQQMQASVKELQLKYESANEEHESRINSLQQELNTKDDAIQSLEVQDHQLKDNIEQLSQNLSEVASFDTESKSMLETYKNELEVKTNAINSLEKSRDELETRIEELQHQSELSEGNYASKINSIEQQLETKENGIQSLETENQRLSGCIGMLQQTLDEVESSAAEHKSQISTYQEEIETCQKDIQSLTAQRDELKASIEQLQGENKSCVEEYTVKIGNIEHELELKENEIQSLRTKNEQLNDTFKKLEQSAEEAKSSAKEYESKISFYQQELKVSGNSVESLTEERNEIQTCLDDLQSQIKSVETDYNSEINSMRQKLELNESEIESLQIQNSQLNSSIKELSQSIEENKDSVNEYKSMLTACQHDLELSQKDIQSLRQNRDELLAEIEDIGHERKSMEEDYVSKLDSVQQQLEVKENDIESLNAQNNQLNANVNKLLQSLEEAKRLHKEYKTKFTSCQQELESSRNDVTFLRQDRADLQNKIETLQQENKSSTEEQHMLQIRSDRNEQELKELASYHQDLETSHGNMTSLRDELQDKIEELQRKNKSLEEDVSSLRQDKTKLQNKIDQLQQKNQLSEEHKSQILSVRSQLQLNKLSSYQQDLESGRNDAVAPKHDLAELQNKIEELQQKNKSLEEEHRLQIRSVRNQLELERHASYEQDMESGQNDMASLGEELQNKIEELQQKNKSLVEDVTFLRKDKAELLNKIEQLQEKNLFGEEHKSQVLPMQSQLELKKLASYQQDLESSQTVLASLSLDRAELQNKIEELQQENKSLKEKHSFQISSSRNQLELKNNEIQSVRGQNYQLKENIEELQQNLKNFRPDRLSQSTSMSHHDNQNDLRTSYRMSDSSKYRIDDLQKALQDKERELETSNLNEAAVQKQLSTLQKQTDKDQHLLNLKDDEITQLQERIFNLQTQINGLLSKISSANRSSSAENLSTPGPFGVGSNSLNASLGSGIQSLPDGIPDTLNTSWSSVSEKGSMSQKKSIEYTKKIKPLEIKLTMSEQRIDILEKEKNDLRKELLAQVQANKQSTKSLGDVDSPQKEVGDLKGKLEAKSSFIKDLKAELLKTCNSLIEKQKEVDELLKYKESTEGKSKSTVGVDLKTRFSDPLPLSTEASINELKKHKWDLIQEIFKQQKTFYERKNIHQGHFEKFQSHIEKLRDLQSSSPFFKSGSAPLLNASTTSNRGSEERCENTLKNLRIELELDIECLQNFKIFLKRFFIPLVLQSCQSSGTDPKNDDTDTGPKLGSTEQGENAHAKTKSASGDKASSAGLVSKISPASLRSTDVSSHNRLIITASDISNQLDSIESGLRNAKSKLQHFDESDSVIGDSPRKNAAKTLLLKMFQEVRSLLEKTALFSLNTTLKKLGLFDIEVLRSPSKQGISGMGPLISSGEIIELSRSSSLSPMSFEEAFHPSIPGSKSRPEPSDHSMQNGTENKATSATLSLKSIAVGGSQESVFLRSHISSPDLGIESDPNHESSAPEQMEKEDFRDKMSKRIEGGTKSKLLAAEKPPSSSMFSFGEGVAQLIDNSSSFSLCDTLHAVGMLHHYELLKKEVQESLVGIKVILSRTGDGLHHSKYTSPRKNLEYTTFKAIRDASSDIETCLQEATKLVDNFWIAPCPSVDNLNMLIQQNHTLQEKLRGLKEAKRKQESYFKDAMEKLKNAEVLRENMEKKISKKLVKTKKVIRQAQLKMIEKESQAESPIPRYPDSDPTGHEEQ